LCVKKNKLQISPGYYAPFEKIYKKKVYAQCISPLPVMALIKKRDRELNL